MRRRCDIAEASLRTRGPFRPALESGADNISDDTQPSLSFAGKFNVIANLDKGIDGVGETDGLTVTAKALPGYPEGMLIVQDGYNRMPLQPQNFKVIDWREVKKAIK